MSTGASTWPSGPSLPMPMPMPLSRLGALSHCPVGLPVTTFRRLFSWVNAQGQDLSRRSMSMWSRHRHLRPLAALGVALLVGGVVTSFVPPAAQGADSGWAIVNGGAPDPQANQLLLNTTCSNAWDCWAVGAIIPEVQNAQPQALAEHWDGSAWSDVSGVQPPGQQASVLYDVSCVTSSDCWGVGGQQTDSQGNDPTVLMEHWNGAGWSVAATPPTGGLLFSVSCPAANDCWAVGATLDPVLRRRDRITRLPLERIVLDDGSHPRLRTER